MNKYENLKKLKEDKFKRLVGVKKATFERMLKVYEKYHKKKKFQGGRPNKLKEEDQIVLMLEYYREYRSMAHIAFDYGIAESSVSRIIKEVEGVMIKSGEFSLPSKRELYKGGGVELSYIMIDATESPIQRPKKKQKRYYSGKKKDTQ